MGVITAELCMIQNADAGRRGEMCSDGCVVFSITGIAAAAAAAAGPRK
jgi:hypothetical protein